MRTRCSILWLAGLAAVQLSAAHVRAQDSVTLDRNYIAIKAMLGIGGSRSVEGDSVSVGNTSFNITDSVKNKDKLLLSYGISGQYMFSLHRYFALGGLLGLMSWQSSSANDDASRNLGLDVAAVPQGRLPISNAFELYLSLPIGLTFDMWNEVENSNSVAGIASLDLKSNTAVGLAVSLLAGARFALADHFGLFAEVGYTHRQFTHELTLTASAVGINLPEVKADASLSLDQFALNLGAFF